MQLDLHAGTDGDWEAPEVQLSGTARALSAFGELLNDAHPKTLALQSAGGELHPVSIDILVIEPSETGGGRLDVLVTDKCLRLKGNRTALNKLGDSLINFFNDGAEVGDHFHLEYFEGNEVLNETSCTLVFMRDR